MRKLDHLKICNDQGIPLEDFRLAFCIRCLQAECVRSQHGLSKFDARVSTWEERLFHAPALPKTDPRYSLISAKKFLALPVGPTPVIREWIDPATLDTPSPGTQIPVNSVLPLPPQKVEPAVTPEVVEKMSEPPLPEPPPPAHRQNLLVNTPYMGPKTLGNPKETNEPVRDTWDAPLPPKTTESMVRPGARIKIGS